LQTKQQDASMPSKLILAVDDDTIFLELLEELLKDEGYPVQACTQGDQCPPTVKELQPALVILDVRLPQLSGLAVVDLLKRDPQTAAIPVLVCSASTPALQTAERRLQEHGVQILPKPFDLQELLDKIKQMIGSPD
jgi:CheY-like chemotaxis protein